MEVWCIILAAGRGQRFGGHKQFTALGGRRLVDIAVSQASETCDAVVLVLPPDSRWQGRPVAAAIAGGATRADSVRAGLSAVPPSAEIVVVHDAAHPLAAAHTFGAVVAAVRDGAAAALPVLPLVDVLKRVEGPKVTATIGREGLGLAQMPQAFRASVLRTVHRCEPQALEDSALVEALCEPVVAVPGEPTNLHITSLADLAMAERLLDGSGGTDQRNKAG